MNTKQTIGSFLLLILLFLSQLTMALPPSKPGIFLHNEGSVVTVRWYAENADGYRLFYAPYPETEPVEMIEMGTRTEYSLRLPENSAYYVAVQAYNQDGDSPYSDSKYFILDEFALMDKVDVDPDILPLRFDHVAVDGYIAFLPTEADAEEQAQRLRTAHSTTNRSERASQLGSPVFYEDGKIGLRVDIAPGVVERDLLLNFCLEIGDECRTLLAWDDGTVGYEETLFVPSVKTDVEKSLYADLLMPSEVITELRNLVKVPREFNLRITAVNSVNPQNIAVHAINVPIVDVGGRQIRREKGEGKITFLGKNFGSDKFGARFEIGMELYPYAGYKVSRTDTHTKNEEGKIETKTEKEKKFTAGIQIGPELSLKTTLFGKELTMISGGLKFTKNIGQNLSVTTELTLVDLDLGKVGDTIDALGKIVKVLKPFLEPEQAKNWDKTMETLRKFPIGTYCKSEGGYKLKNQLPKDEQESCSAIPEFINEESEGEDKKDNSVSENLPNALINIPLATAIGYNGTFLVWIVPVKLSAGINGTVGFKGGGGLDTGPIVLKFTAGPYAELGAYASAAVTLYLAEAGVKGALTIITEMIQLNMHVLITTEPKIAGVIKNILSGPSGSISLYAKAYVPRWGMPPWEQEEWLLTLIDWKTFTREDSLVKWGGYTETCGPPEPEEGKGKLKSIESLSSFSKVCKPSWPSWDSVGISETGEGDGKVGGTVNSPGGVDIPNLITDEPSDDAEGWACFYMESGQKPSFCFSANKAEPVVGFKFSGAFNDKIKEIKVWKNTIVSTYQDMEFNGKGIFVQGPSSGGPKTHSLDRQRKLIGIGTDTVYDMSSAKIIYDKEPDSSEKGWACFYEDARYEGKRFCLRVLEGKNTYKISDVNQHIAGFHDEISSIKVGSQTSVTLYKDAKFKGDSKILQGSGYVGNFNDEADSVEIFSPALTGWACFYEHTNFGGKEQCYEIETGQNGRWVPWVGDNMNDEISSIKMGPNIEVVIYEHSNFGGNSKTFNSSGYVSGFNDEASSLKIRFK
ncbi:peptidase inhibitor family I36 protein [Thiotrichales bacterium HSG1]|nr:peptidase inhibitor family I36 protein [Thiotrichales bacterium HSG1]